MQFACILCISFFKIVPHYAVLFFHVITCRKISLTHYCRRGLEIFLYEGPHSKKQTFLTLQSLLQLLFSVAVQEQLQKIHKQWIMAVLKQNWSWKLECYLNFMYHKISLILLFWLIIFIVFIILKCKRIFSSEYGLRL